MLKASNITKRFGSITVLQDVNFELAAGEVHALFGANGAGKSTLSKLIAGHIQPTSGKIILEDNPRIFRSSRDALEAGVAMVMQETSLAPDLSVLENIYLPLYGRRGSFRFKNLRNQAYDVLEQLGVSTDIDLDATTGELSAAHRQLVEIARALALNAKVVIFDEPTTSLSPSEVAKLFAVMEKLRKNDCAMVFVSHRMEELFAITDRVTILRDGRTVASCLKTSDISQTELVRLMIGRDLASSKPRTSTSAATEVLGTIALEVKNLKAKPLLNDVSFSLHQGEILGLGGLVGAGRSETLEAIFGLRSIQEGSMLLGGMPYMPRKPLDAIRAGLGFVAEDRRAQSILPDLSVRENLMVAALSAQRSLIKQYGRYHERADELAVKLDLPTHRLDDENLLSFSGGMQQKILIMRWLLLQPRVLLLDEPTKGIDIGARSAIYALLRDIAAQGVAILVVSSDFQELMDLCDRIVPVSDGRSIGTVPTALLDAEKLLMLAAPRSSMAGLRMLLNQIARQHAAAAFWAIVDPGSLICLAASEGSEAVLGFSSGMVCAVEQCKIPNALSSVRDNLVFETSGLATLQIGVTNARGHDLGVIGIVFKDDKPADRAALIRIDLQKFVEQQKDDQITLSL
jgi:ABC-type sugar transport system ATPase subunit